MKVFMDNVPLRYFEIQLKANTKQLHLHVTLAFMHIKLIYELSKDYVVANALINIWYKSKEEYQKEMH